MTTLRRVFQFVVGIVVGTSLTLLIAIIVAPSRKVRNEPPLELETQLRLLLGLALWKFTDIGVLGAAIAGQMMGGLLAAALYMCFPPAGWPAASVVSTDAGKWNGEIERYIWPFLIWLLPASLQSVADKWSIGLITDTATVAAYGIAFQLGFAPLAQLCAALRLVLIPSLFSSRGTQSFALDRREMDLIRISCLIVSVAMVAGVLVFLGVIDPILHLVVRRDYEGISSLIAMCILAGGLFEKANDQIEGFIGMMQQNILLLDRGEHVAVVILNPFRHARRERRP